jgi:hypothetical protein
MRSPTIAFSSLSKGLGVAVPLGLVAHEERHIIRPVGEVKMKLERISIELPFMLKLPNRLYRVPTDGDRPLTLHVLNGYRKVISFRKARDGKEERMVNIASADEVETLIQKIKNRGHEQISPVRTNTILSIINPLEEPITTSDWSNREFPQKQGADIVRGLNR